VCFRDRNYVWGFNFLSVLKCLLTSLVNLMCEFWKLGFLGNIYNRHYCSTSIIRASFCQIFIYLSFFHSSSDNKNLLNSWHFRRADPVDLEWRLGKNRISTTASIVGS
jgi:hypothetical protein